MPNFLLLLVCPDSSSSKPHLPAPSSFSCEESYTLCQTPFCKSGMKTAEQVRRHPKHPQKKKSKNCKGRRGWQKETDEAPSYFFCKHSNQKRRASKESDRKRGSGYGRIPYHSIPECHRSQTIMHLRILECSDSRPIMHLWLGLDSTPLCSLQELSIKTILLHNFKFVTELYTM